MILLKESRENGRKIFTDVSLADSECFDLMDLLQELEVPPSTTYHLLPGKSSPDDKGFKQMLLGAAIESQGKRLILSVSLSLGDFFSGRQQTLQESWGQAAAFSQFKEQTTKKIASLEEEIHKRARMSDKVQYFLF